MDPHEIIFPGRRLRFDSTRRVDDLLAALYADIGADPVPISDIAIRHPDWDGYERDVASYAGPSGFMLFAVLDHGAWIGKAGIDRKVVRLVLGNPLIAISMIRHDVTAGLFAPVEVLVTEEAGDRSALTYVVPSSLMVVTPNPPLLAAAEDLDAKLFALARTVTG
jgi:hypothetical protein